MLAIIIPYFNPIGYQYRLKNCLIVREEYRKLGYDPFIIELSITDKFEIENANWKVNSNSCMFHKESLINYAVERLPPQYDKVMWADADILPFQDNWFELTDSELDKFEIVQCFKNVLHNNFCDSCDIKNKNLNIIPYEMSMIAGGSDTSLGYVWAARRDIFKHGLYPYAIIGSGDSLFVNAVYKSVDRWVTNVNPEAQSCYLNWCSRIKKRKVGFVDCNVLHLWHGNLAARQYLSRHAILHKNKFDPLKDIVLNKDQMMEFPPNNPNLKKEVWDYFCSRREDSPEVKMI